MVAVDNNHSGYVYNSSDLNHSHRVLLPTIQKILASECHGKYGQRIFEIGCGNGSIANELTKLGYDVIGIDPSEQGIAFAAKSYPNLKLTIGSAYDNLASEYGTFPLVLSLEVVEHLFFPKVFAKNLYDLLDPGGTAVISTPYHGYLKNLALAVSGKLDAHFTALWDYGHIKFWSKRTLGILLAEAGFIEIHFIQVGRIPVLAKSMIAVSKKPQSFCKNSISL